MLAWDRIQVVSYGLPKENRDGEGEARESPRARLGKDRLVRVAERLDDVHAVGAAASVRELDPQRERERRVDLVRAGERGLGPHRRAADGIVVVQLDRAGADLAGDVRHGARLQGHVWAARGGRGRADRAVEGPLAHRALRRGTRRRGQHDGR